MLCSYLPLIYIYIHIFFYHLGPFHSHAYRARPFRFTLSRVPVTSCIWRIFKLSESYPNSQLNNILTICFISVIKTILFSNVTLVTNFHHVDLRWIFFSLSFCNFLYLLVNLEFWSIKFLTLPGNPTRDFDLLLFLN